MSWAICEAIAWDFCMIIRNIIKIYVGFIRGVSFVKGICVLYFDLEVVWFTSGPSPHGSNSRKL